MISPAAGPRHSPPEPPWRRTRSYFNHDFPDIYTAKVGINWRFGSLFGP
jgi:hypothetical protein